VLDYESEEQVGELHGLVTSGRFGHLLDGLGRYYNNAELAVERNNHGHSALNTLSNTCYEKQHRPNGKLGWPNDTKTKPVMINGLAAAIASGSLTIHHSSALVDECFSYVALDGGATGAQPGRHDDPVIAAAIAWQVRQRPRPSFLIARA